jgi:hypothetical protein
MERSDRPEHREDLGSPVRPSSSRSDIVEFTTLIRVTALAMVLGAIVGFFSAATVGFLLALTATGIADNREELVFPYWWSAATRYQSELTRPAIVCVAAFLGAIAGACGGILGGVAVTYTRRYSMYGIAYTMAGVLTAHFLVFPLFYDGEVVWRLETIAALMGAISSAVIVPFITHKYLRGREANCYLPSDG